MLEVNSTNSGNDTQPKKKGFNRSSSFNKFVVVALILLALLTAGIVVRANMVGENSPINLNDPTLVGSIDNSKVAEEKEVPDKTKPQTTTNPSTKGVTSQKDLLNKARLEAILLEQESLLKLNENLSTVFDEYSRWFLDCRERLGVPDLVKKCEGSVQKLLDENQKHYDKNSDKLDELSREFNSLFNK